MAQPGSNSIRSRTVQHSPDKQVLKARTKALVQAAGGQDAASAACTRIKRQQSFSDYGLTNTPEFAPIDVIDELEAVTRGTAGWPLVTRELCARRGGAFVELPQGDPGDANWHHAMGALTKEFAELSTGLCLALADGKVDAAEVRERDLIAQADDVISVVVNLRALFERVMEGGR